MLTVTQLDARVYSGIPCRVSILPTVAIPPLPPSGVGREAVTGTFRGHGVRGQSRSSGCSLLHHRFQNRPQAGGPSPALSGMSPMSDICARLPTEACLPPGVRAVCLSVVFYLTLPSSSCNLNIEYSIYKPMASEADMIRRTLQAVLRKAATRYPVVTLTGPRQSGKTTLARMAFPKHGHVSLEDPDQQEFALTDPRGFLNQLPEKVVLDEAQRAPALFSYIQTAADSVDSPGRFILTGSHNFLLLRTISQSLAGRSAVLHLLPFSLSELEGRSPFRLSKIGVELPRGSRPVKAGVMDVMFRGFYPRIHDKRLPPQDWLRNYYQTYVERDVREIVNVGDIPAFGRFVRLCAGRNGQLLNMSSLANDCGITHTTAKRWLSTLEASFLIVLLRPHHRNFNKRLTKRPKLYFLDSGLLCYLLRIQSPDDLPLHSSRGSIFESFVLSELLKNYLHRAEEPSLYFWRDSTGHEVDVVIDRGRKLVPIEIKSAQTVASDFFDGIKHWSALAGAEAAPGALFYAGKRSFRRAGVTVYSWSCL